MLEVADHHGVDSPITRLDACDGLLDGFDGSELAGADRRRLCERVVQRSGPGSGSWSNPLWSRRRTIVPSLAIDRIWPAVT